MMDRIYSSEDEAIAAGPGRSAFQQQQKGLNTPPANQPAALKESLVRLEKARDELAQAEADAAAKTGLVDRWERLLQNRDEAGNRVAQLKGILKQHEDTVAGSLRWLADNLGNPHVMLSMFYDAFRNLVVSERAVQLIPKLIEEKEKGYAASHEAIVNFAHKQGLTHLLAPADREPKRK